MDAVVTHLIIVAVICIVLLIMGHFVLTPSAVMGLGLIAGGTMLAFEELSEKPVFSWTVVVMNGLGVLAVLASILSIRYKHIKTTVHRGVKDLRESSARARDSAKMAKEHAEELALQTKKHAEEMAAQAKKRLLRSDNVIGRHVANVQSASSL